MPYIIFLLIYLLAAYLVFLIAKKLNDKLAVFAWFPFLSDYLITRLARKPAYWWILMYIPILNIYYDYVLWREIFKRFNRNSLYAVLMLIPVINWVGLLLLACVFKNTEVKAVPIEEKKGEEKKAEEKKDEKMEMPEGKN